MQSSLRPGVLVSLLALGGCSSSHSGEWKLIDAKVAVTADNHVSVDATYVNNGGADWGGSRCVIIDWEKGGVQSQDDARAQKQPTSPIDVVETERYCNGGNKSLAAGDRDLFHVVSAHLRDELAGSTVVVAAQDFKGTKDDDRLTIPSP
jgi:hypothetical protein